MVSIGKGTKAEEAGLMPGDKLEARSQRACHVLVIFRFPSNYGARGSG